MSGGCRIFVAPSFGVRRQQRNLSVLHQPLGMAAVLASSPTIISWLYVNGSPAPYHGLSGSYSACSTASSRAASPRRPSSPVAQGSLWTVCTRSSSTSGLCLSQRVLRQSPGLAPGSMAMTRLRVFPSHRKVCGCTVLSRSASQIPRRRRVRQVYGHSSIPRVTRSRRCI